MALATAIAGGIQHFLGFPIPSGPVLILDWELSQNEQGRRAWRIARGMGLPRPPKRLLYISPAEPLPKVIGKIRKLINDHKLVLVIIDSFGPACGNNPEEAVAVMPLFNELRRLGVSTLILDHQSKMQEGQSYARKAPFGSAFKFNLSRSVIHLERVGATEGELKVMLRHTKNNLGAQHPDLGLKLTFGKQNPAKPWIRIEQADIKSDPSFSESLNAGDRILMSLEQDGPATNDALSQRTGILPKTVGNYLGRLKRSGKVNENGKDGRKIIWEAIDPLSQDNRGGKLGSSKPPKDELKHLSLSIEPPMKLKVKLRPAVKGPDAVRAQPEEKEDACL